METSKSIDKRKIDVEETISKRKQQSINTKTKILKTAIELIKSKGYVNVSVSEICEKSGLTKGAFYHHFHSKQDILGSIYLDTDARILKNRSNILEKSNSFERIMEISLIFAEMSEYKGVEIIKQTIRNNFESQNMDEFFSYKKRPAIQFFLDIIKDGQKNGEIKNDVSPDYIFWFLNSSHHGFQLDWCYKNGRYNFKEVIEESLPRILNSFMVQSTEYDKYISVRAKDSDID